MFDQLSDRLQGVLSDVRSRGKLSEDDVNKALREVRLALLEADVNFQVVNDELTALMGGAGRDLVFNPNGLTVILMAGLQGSGKTTATAKLAKLLAKDNR